MAVGSLQSPGILAIQNDLSTVVGNVPTSQAAFAGVFRWGPIGNTVVLGSETDEISWFGLPSDFNPETWFVAADFLSFSDYLVVSRAADYEGNTVSKTFVGNATNLAIASNSNVLQLTNTQFLSVGMQLFWTNTETYLPDQLTSNSAPTITSIVNGTAVTLSEDASANIAAISVIFRDPKTYVALGQEVVSQAIDWEAQGVLNPGLWPSVQNTFSAGVTWVARYLGDYGNSLRVSQCDTPNQFSSNTNLVANAYVNSTATGLYATVGSNTLVIQVTPANTANATMVGYANTLINQVALSFAQNDLVQTGNNTLGFQYLQIANVGIPTLNVTSNVYTLSIGTTDSYKVGQNTVSTTVARYWEFFNLFTQPPGTSQYVTSFGNSAAIDEMHLVVVDELGYFTRNPGAVLEKYEGLSRAKDAQAVDGGSNYYQSVLSQGSKYIWPANPRSLAMPNTAQFIQSSTASAPLNIQFYGGSSGLPEGQVDIGALNKAYQIFSSSEDYPDISLIMAGKARGLGVTSNTQLGNFILDNVVTPVTRQDMICFVSPDKPLVVNNPGYEASAIVGARVNMDYSSYEFIDSGYYYRYDEYNDEYWWVPMNGQMAGLCAQTDLTNAPWWSPAGYNRGHLKNVVRLAWNPKQTARDTLYNNDVNPVISVKGGGTILYGDKTGLGLQSAFSRINVQRLFIVLKKAIRLMARQFLFEFNDDFTRARFKAIVTPYLKDVQGQRGITDFIVVCDKSNNIDQVIMNNQFVGTIGVKPNYAIDFIYLNFTAVRNDVSFSQALGISGSN